MTRLTVEPTAEDAARRAALRMVEEIGAARERRGLADLALAGGSTPRRAYEILAGELEDWRGVHLWFGDERAVGPEDPDSNYWMVAETLLAVAPIPEDQVHRMLGELGADETAAAYREELAVLAPESGALPILDLVLLGMGPDGHTASLFPNHPALQAPESLSCVAVHDAPKPPPDRVTLTLPALRAARRRLLLTTGESKAWAVARALGGPDPSVPASLVGGPDTELVVDEAAVPARH